MNAAFNHALRQSQQLAKDLEILEQDTSKLGQQGQISATLASFTRTINEYQVLSDKEPVNEKREKAKDRLNTFKTQLHDYKQQFDRLKAQRQDALRIESENSRHELLGRRINTASTSTTTSDNPYAASSSSSSAPIRNESTFINDTSNQLDDFIQRGQAVLGDLVQQKDILKSTQRKLYSTANTLGISNQTIHYIESRARQDKWLFYIGVLITLVAFYYIIKLI